MTKDLFLAQSYQNAWIDYDYSCKNKKTAKWDWIVITASNKRQAEAYQLQIDIRSKENRLPLNTKFIVIPDLNDERVGSGGATLNVLYHLVDRVGIDKIGTQKILLLHSGGDSKRIPQYSASGKLFAPIPRALPNGKKSTIFDELIIMASGIPARTSFGMLVFPSDTEILFNPLQLDLLSCDTAGLSMKARVEEGKEHGVFLGGNSTSDSCNKNVARFLHKQSEEVLRNSGAVDAFDMVDIDTGCVWLGTKVIYALLELISDNNKISEEKFHQFVNPKVCLSFYADFLYPMAEESTLEEYYKETPENVLCKELTECRTKIWEKINKFRLSLVKMTPAQYIHFGMTHEIFDLLVWDIDKYKFLGWEKRILTNAVSGRVINTYVEPSSHIEDDTFVEDCIIRENCHIGSGTIISGLDIREKTIPENVVMHALKLHNGKYVCRIYGRDDNPKSSKTASFLGNTLLSLMKTGELEHSDLWNISQASIWNAKLYSECNTIEEAVDMALLLYKIIQKKASNDEIKKWKSSTRYSLKESFQDADVPAILKRQDEIEHLVRIKKSIAVLENEGEISKAIDILKDNFRQDDFKQLCSYAKQALFPINMRIYLMLSDLSKQIGKEIKGLRVTDMEDKAYEAIRHAITVETVEQHIFHRETAKFIQNELTNIFPVRVNFCGSPSDAAPYCLENGGTMLDGALLLKGKKPISVTVRQLKEKKIILESVDQGCKKTFDNISDIKDCGNPYDEFALHKSVLIASGLIPFKADGRTLQDICEEIGGGLQLITSVEVPKGSGLGTSSIIAAGCIKTINQILNQDITDQCIYAKVFLAEQLMTTGGGWQDQVGGLREGIKYFTSRPGIYQRINVEHLKLDDNILNEMNERFALIFSGQRRLARNVLREEMNQCIRNDNKAIKAISSIRECCALMRYNLEKGDITSFAHYITKQFELVKQLDKGASNTCIEYIFSICDDLIDGKSICGAGGGGFLQVILKKGVTKEELKERIRNEFNDCGVEVWDCKLI